MDSLVAHISHDKELAYGIFNFQCGLCNESYYREFIRHLNSRIWEHIVISLLTKKNVKPKGSAVSNHLLLCTHLPSFGSFSVLAMENIKFVLKLKESLLVMRDRPTLNRYIRSAPLYLSIRQSIAKVNSSFGEFNSRILLIRF